MFVCVVTVVKARTTSSNVQIPDSIFPSLSWKPDKITAGAISCDCRIHSTYRDKSSDNVGLYAFPDELNADRPAKLAACLRHTQETTRSSDDYCCHSDQYCPGAGARECWGLLGIVPSPQKIFAEVSHPLRKTPTSTNSRL